MRKNVLKYFEEKFNVKLITQECGFDTIVTGFIPTNGVMFLEIDSKIATSKPKNAYQHSNILGIIGGGDETKRELAIWVNDLLDKHCKLVAYKKPKNDYELSETGRLNYMLTMEE